jgi:hypothetical protein
MEQLESGTVQRNAHLIDPSKVTPEMSKKIFEEVSALTDDPEEQVLLAYDRFAELSMPSTGKKEAASRLSAPVLSRGRSPEKKQAAGHNPRMPEAYVARAANIRPVPSIAQTTAEGSQPVPPNPPARGPSTRDIDPRLAPAATTAARPPVVNATVPAAAEAGGETQVLQVLEGTLGLIAEQLVGLGEKMNSLSEQPAKKKRRTKVQQPPPGTRRRKRKRPAGDEDDPRGTSASRRKSKKEPAVKKAGDVYTEDELKDLVTRAVSKALLSLGIPDLALSPKPPEWEVEFDFGQGEFSARYHWVSEHEGGLFLVYDTRFKYGTTYVPPNMGDKPIAVSLPQKGQVYQCLSPRWVHPFGIFKIINLVIVKQDEMREEGGPPVVTEFVPDATMRDKDELSYILGDGK